MSGWVLFHEMLTKGGGRRGGDGGGHGQVSVAFNFFSSKISSSQLPDDTINRSSQLKL